jgi:hypothetical protein
VAGLAVGFLLALAGLAAYRAAVRPTSHPAKARPGEIDVLQAVTLNPSGPVSVRGYVMSGPYGLRLCRGLKGSSPPDCLGPWLELDGVNEGSFSLKSGRRGSTTVSWGPQPVSLLGRVSGAHMAVDHVLQ